MPLAHTLVICVLPHRQLLHKRLVTADALCVRARDGEALQDALTLREGLMRRVGRRGITWPWILPPV
eukprot:scaffold112983_cov21-Tisochrysis_lutea.AAC.3